MLNIFNITITIASFIVIFLTSVIFINYGYNIIFNKFFYKSKSKYKIYGLLLISFLIIFTCLFASILGAFTEIFILLDNKIIKNIDLYHIISNSVTPGILITCYFFLPLCLFASYNELFLELCIILIILISSNIILSNKMVSRNTNSNWTLAFLKDEIKKDKYITIDNKKFRCFEKN